MDKTGLFGSPCLFVISTYFDSIKSWRQESQRSIQKNTSEYGFFSWDHFEDNEMSLKPGHSPN